jgi:hypothetical protein
MSPFSGLRLLATHLPTNIYSIFIHMLDNLLYHWYVVYPSITTFYFFSSTTQQRTTSQREKQQITPQQRHQ